MAKICIINQCHKSMPIDNHIQLNLIMALHNVKSISPIKSNNDFTSIQNQLFFGPACAQLD